MNFRKNSIKIIGDKSPLYAQGYFVYDSKKSGAVTVSHLRFGKQPIHSSYLVADNDAQFIGCHQTIFLERYDLLSNAADHAVFLLNTAYPVDKVWASLPSSLQQTIRAKHLQFYIIDGYRVALNVYLLKYIKTEEIDI